MDSMHDIQQVAALMAFALFVGLGSILGYFVMKLDREAKKEDARRERLARFKRARQ